MDKVISRIKDEIKRLSDECANTYTRDLIDKLNYGKMLRSRLLLAISGESERAIQVCALIEIIHSASLLHDDVIDMSLTRRGEASINALYGNKNAIMLGDMLYSKAYFELCKINVNLAQSISSAVFRLSLGEIADVALSQSFHTQQNAYIQMCADKTAALIAATAECGAILINKDTKDFREYGENLGIAFQLIDDVLDISADSKILGKPSMSDFAAGKTTLPYMYLYENLNKTERERLLLCFGREINEKEKAFIKDKMQEHHILPQCISKAKEYANKAHLAIKHIKNDKLNDMIQQMIERDF